MAIKITNVTKLYGERKILDSINLEIGDGEIMGFAGINGAGKTTTIKITAGVVYPNDGDVLIDGMSIVHDARNAKYEVAWVPENPLFDPFQQPVTLFSEYGAYFGKSHTEIKEQAHDLMGMVGLDGLLKKRVGQFSNGMKKRLMIALSLFQNPKNFLLDETFTGLDPEGARFLREELVKLKSKGKGILLSTHILSELNELADRVAIVNGGRIVDVSRVDEIMKHSVFVIRCDGEESKIRTALEKFGNTSTLGKEYELRLSGNRKVNPWEIGKVLENYGLKVHSIERKENTMERYFFEKIGQNQSV
ncbi:MAG: ABC transporter ATP-binding protein [Cuniculiplasma sp.]